MRNHPFSMTRLTLRMRPEFGTSAGIQRATHFSLSSSSPHTAGTAFNLTVTALDASDHTVPSYPGTVAITSDDVQGVMPSNSTLTLGVKVFSVTLKTAGLPTVTATDTITSSITGAILRSIVPGTITTLLTVAPATVISTLAFNFTVTGFDAYSNTATNYTGQVTFTSSDGSATLPGNGTLTNGTRVFSATLVTVGTKTITAADTITGAVTDTSDNITVGSAESFNWYDVSSQTVDHAPYQATFSIEKLLAGSRDTGWTGTVTFSKASGPATTLTFEYDDGLGWTASDTYDFVGGDAGTHNFRVTFDSGSPGSFVLRVTSGGVTGDSLTFTVS